MRIAILSYRPLARQAAEEELMLQKAAREKGYRCRIFRAERFQMIFNANSPWLLYDGKPFHNYDVVITRPSVLRNVGLHCSLIEQMELSGLLVCNRYASILMAKNKIKTTQILDRYGISVPRTAIIRRPDDIVQAVKLVGGFPLIVKHPVGSFGQGVSIVESMRALKSFLMWNVPMYMLQEYVKFARGKDIRIFVIGGKVVASMMRSAQKGEFRANIELGARGSKVEITEEEAAIALRAVQALDLHYGGVDIMRSRSGPVVLEVNSNPGFKELENSSGVNVSGALIDYVVELKERQ